MTFGAKMELMFCESCNVVTEGERCPVCGKKKLREVRDDDFCYFVTLSEGYARYFEENLKSENIPVVMLGQGYSSRMHGGTSSAYGLYIPYVHLERVYDIYNLLFFGGETEPEQTEE